VIQPLFQHRDPARVQRRPSEGAGLTAGTGIELIVAEFESSAVKQLLAEWNRELIAADPALRLGGPPIRPGDFSPPRGVFLLAKLAQAPVGCGGVRTLDPATGEVKRLFVSCRARGHGAGGKLLDALEHRARELGLVRLRLDTPGNDAAALALFRHAGYEPIGDYNGNPRARHWFEKSL
jgi:ribosomal protein S18 acetylase RimI-like enzyme